MPHTDTNAAAQWINTYKALATAQPASCSSVSVPALPAGLNAAAFGLPAPASAPAPSERVIYTQDTIAERQVLFYRDAQGCVHAGESGRLLAFDQRAVMSPLANLALPASLGDTSAVAMVIDSMFVCINVGPRQLAESLIVEQLDLALAKYSVAPSSIRLDLSQTLLTARREEARQVLPLLRGCNIQIAVDNFGTGTSSLTLLGELDPARIKIDISVVAGMSHAVRAQEVARGIIALANEMGVSVVAEGVETEGQKVLLRELGCTHAQGYALAAPMTSDKLESWISAWDDGTKALEQAPGNTRLH